MVRLGNRFFAVRSKRRANSFGRGTRSLPQLRVCKRLALESDARQLEELCSLLRVKIRSNDFRFSRRQLNRCLKGRQLELDSGARYAQVRFIDVCYFHAEGNSRLRVDLMKDFTGRVAIVTGAARGLGRASAARLHERGAAVAVNVRDRERAESVAKSIGERALAVPGDLAAAGVPEQIVRLTLERFGRVDILVNNAALARSTRLPVLSGEEWRAALEVNLTAPFLLIKAVLPAMKAQRYGRIVNISSSAGRMVSTLGGAHYTASKAGLLGLTRAAAKELGPFGITVNAVCPGMIDTELTRENATPELLAQLSARYPVPRLGTALEVADLICFAASEAAGYTTGASL